MYKIDSFSQFGVTNLFGYSPKKTKLIIDPDHNYFQRSLISDRNNYENLILINGCEPLFFTMLSDTIVQYQNYFNKILSSDEYVLNNCPNSELFVYGSCWVLTNDNNQKIDLLEGYKNNFKIEDKKFKLSFIRSNKKNLIGHRFRHEIDNLLEMETSFELLFPKEKIETKLPLFQDSMFHLAIENSQQKNYFTEKIVDCFMSFTMPIYWGCPNIGEFFDLDGIIVINNKTELETILKEITIDDYLKRQTAMIKNYEICMNKKYSFFYERLTDICQN